MISPIGTLSDGTGVRSHAALGNAARAGFFAASGGTSLVKVNVAWDCHEKEQPKINKQGLLRVHGNTSA
jgi:hypothetical protein